MARKSRWQQFSDNFNGVYGTVTNATRNIQMGRASRADYNDEAGNLLTGDALDRARVNALADIENRYGRTAEGLALRSNQAALQATNFENDMNIQLRPELLRQRGALQSGLMEAQTSSANASAANSFANANATNTLLPGRVENQGLANVGLRLGNDLTASTFDSNVEEARAAANQATADAEVAAGTVDSRIETGLATADQTRATATNAQVNAAENLEVSADRVEATIAELRAAAAESQGRQNTAETAARDNSVVAEIMAEALNMDFGDNTAAADAWIVEQLRTADMTPQGRLSAAETVNKFGVEAVGARAAELTQQATEAYRSGGISAVADLYDKVQDGVDGRVVRDGDRVSIVLDRGDGLDEIVATATGPDAERVVADQAMQIFGDPMRAMEMAAATLQYETGQAGLAQTGAETDRTRAQTGLIDQQTFSETLARDRTEAQTALLEAQTEQTLQEIQAARDVGGTNQRKLQEIAITGLSRLMTDVNFATLEPEEQNQIIARYRAEFGITDNNSFEGWSFEVLGD